MSKIVVSPKSYFCTKMRVFTKMPPKSIFLPIWHFYIMPNIKVDISSFAMMHDVGVCKVGALSHPKM